ncbi:MAG: hypothetical protein LQ350_004891 [Teloschistes chrysophthalmus]|nr:MAG: hypothetical protein LQ350_004891 [Niorma chrysophthalma]
MKHEAGLLILAFSATTQAAPIMNLSRREVPQEHSHNTFLDSVTKSLRVNNPDNIGDAVFGLLGNAAAAAGQGSITNTDCLHQATADQAFTNAKAAGDVTGMTDALIYAALERNTAKVGQASVACTAIKAKNPEIAAISPHQDPASSGAAATNKAATLALAKQIASVGGDPQQALKSGTFAPGDVNDPTAKGNTCDTIEDQPGCIFTQNLLVEDATAAEIDAAAAGATGSGAQKGAANPSTGTSSASAKNKTGTASGNSTASAPSKSSAKNEIQTFTGSLGGPPPPVTSSTSARPFSVNGATFLNSVAALQRSCAIQHNACADAANSGKLSGGVAQCDTQETACNAAAKKTKNHKRTLDFGSCSDPTIKFADGLDGRKEAAFAPVNTADFTHGSALNIGVISGFICQQLQDKCKAGADATTACTKAQMDAASKTGQAAANAFNAALGGSAATTQVQASGNTTSAATGTTGTKDSAAGGSNQKATGASAGSTGNNIQNFTGMLGGSPPSVLKSSGARPFSVNGNTFVNAAAALQRSCDIQHNACANAANSGKLAGGVGQCETQQEACAAAGAGGK